MTSSPSSVTLGLDCAADELADLKHARLGLVTSDAAVNRHRIPARLALNNAGFNLVRLFSPEHGLAATAPAGESVPDSLDPLTGLPVISLMGKTLCPMPETLNDLDAILFDLPDVGARFYTYIWTLSNVCDTAADLQRPVIILDRPNPLSGLLDRAEGPMLDESYYSGFVGRWSIPIRHSLTIGELATLWKSQGKIRSPLRIVPCRNLRRTMLWPDTGLPFVNPSPNLRHFESIALYPGTCLFEATNLSEGRGTDAPFKIISAPFLDGQILSNALNALALPGVHAEPVQVIPRSHKFAGQTCHGLRLTVTDYLSLRPVALGLHMLALAAKLFPANFAFDQSGNPSPFGKLVGIPGVPELLQQPTDAIISNLTACPQWPRLTRPHLLYD